MRNLVTLMSILISVQLFASNCRVDLDTIIPIIWEVESRSKSGKILGDYCEEQKKYKAFGGLQIWKVVVIDVNRVFKTDYEHKDMFDIDKAQDVAKKYLQIARRSYIKRYGEEPTEEILVRRYNGGAYKTHWKRTNNYWNEYKKVKNRL